MRKYFQKYSEKSVLMGLIDYFRILKTFIIFLFMSNVQNQNCKVLEEILGGSNSDTVKTTLSGLHNFQDGLLLFKSSSKTSRH